MNETLESYKIVLSNLKEYVGQDIVVGLTDGESFIGIWQGDRLKITAQVGDKIMPNDPMYETFRTGNTIKTVVPAEIHGVPFRSITAAVRNSSGKIVGTVGVGTSLELIHSVENIVSDIQVKLDDTNKKINLFNDTSKQVSDKSQNVLEVMSKISEISKQISSATKEINDISMQTQILAINASVEAAHAGAMGKGFAVVSQEMKKLSATSQKSSQKIFELISELTVQVEQNYSELKKLQETIESQGSSAVHISENIDNSKELAVSVLNELHK